MPIDMYINSPGGKVCPAAGAQAARTGRRADGVARARRISDGPDPHSTGPPPGWISDGLDR